MIFSFTSIAVASSFDSYLIGCVGGKTVYSYTVLIFICKRTAVLSSSLTYFYFKCGIAEADALILPRD